MTSVRAGVVILAAGTLGSTEVLLRSREHGLTLSRQLGQHFTGNGDVLGFGYNNDEAIKGIGYGDQPAADARADLGPVGPCITGVIDQREQPELATGMVLEEGSLPGALAPLLSVMFASAAATIGRDTDSGLKVGGSEESSTIRNKLE